MLWVQKNLILQLNCIGVMISDPRWGSLQWRLNCPEYFFEFLAEIQLFCSEMSFSCNTLSPGWEWIPWHICDTGINKIMYYIILNSTMKNTFLHFFCHNIIKLDPTHRTSQICAKKSFLKWVFPDITDWHHKLWWCGHGWCIG